MEKRRDLNLIKQDLENIIFGISDKFPKSRVSPPIIYRVYKGNKFLFKIKEKRYKEIKDTVQIMRRRIPNLKIKRELSCVDNLDEALKSGGDLIYRISIKDEMDCNLEIFAGCEPWKNYPIIHILKRGDYEEPKRQNKKINEILESNLPESAFTYDYDNYSSKSRWEIPYTNQLILNISLQVPV